MDVRRQRRRERNLAINRELLRKKIAAGKHHYKVKELIEELKALRAEVVKKAADKKNPFAFSREVASATSIQLASIAKQADLHMRLLAKYLPDARSLEEDDEGKNPMKELAAAFADVLDAE